MTITKRKRKKADNGATTSVRKMLPAKYEVSVWFPIPQSHPCSEPPKKPLIVDHGYWWSISKVNVLTLKALARRPSAKHKGYTEFKLTDGSIAIVQDTYYTVKRIDS
jgi:hypothetical protein